MFDTVYTTEILTQIHEATKRIIKRVSSVSSPEEFTNSESGMEKLDGACMQLITIGESLKNLDKITNGELFVKYPDIEWKKAKGLRDIISHHYFDLDAEVIFDVCKNHIPDLKITIERMLEDLKRE